MAEIAELFGLRVAPDLENPPEEWIARQCPFTAGICDVSANRSDRAFLSLDGAGVAQADKEKILSLYGTSPLPLGICSLLTQRHNEVSARPWIVCPKRLLELRRAPLNLPPELRGLIPFPTGAAVRCWWEVKFRSRDPSSANFFEYTFDYLFVPRDPASGAPHVVEVMTASTRGGGLTEHMIDALLLRPQRRLAQAVDSPYTPNYRQVFERMLGQLLAKSEICEHWGGRAIWLVQDVLMEYIEQTTAFRTADFAHGSGGNVFLLVYKLVPAAGGGAYELVFDRPLRGFSRSRREADFSSMLGLGYAPPVGKLYDALDASARKKGNRNVIEFPW